MGPLKNKRRLAAIDALVRNAVECGATLLAGGRAIEGRGYFYQPTVLALRDSARKSAAWSLSVLWP